MDIGVLSEPVRRVLLRAGWTPDRAWDTRDARALHEALGFAFSPAAAAFLSALGGLRVQSARGIVLLETSCTDTLRSLGKERLREYEEWVGEALCVVGAAQAGEQILMLSERGALYGGKGEVVIAYGTDLSEALERLCLERTRKRFDLN